MMRGLLNGLRACYNSAPNPPPDRSVVFSSHGSRHTFLHNTRPSAFSRFCQNQISAPAGSSRSRWREMGGENSSQDVGGGKSRTTVHDLDASAICEREQP